MPTKKQSVFMCKCAECIAIQKDIESLSQEKPSTIFMTPQDFKNKLRDVTVALRNTASMWWPEKTLQSLESELEDLAQSAMWAMGYKMNGEPDETEPHTLEPYDENDDPTAEPEIEDD